jgi:hypothetical protein
MARVAAAASISSESLRARRALSEYEEIRVSSAADFMKVRWLLLGGFALTVGVVVWSSQEQPLPKGSDVDFTFTLVPRDANGLGCSSAQPLEGERCEFDADGAPVKVEHSLRPFTTTSQEVVLLSMVFEDPSVSKWLEEADEKKDENRVTVRCEGTFLGRAASVKVRWAPDGSFAVLEDIRIGRMKKCQVTPGP